MSPQDGASLGSPILTCLGLMSSDTIFDSVRFHLKINWQLEEYPIYLIRSVSSLGFSNVGFSTSQHGLFEMVPLWVHQS